MYVSQRGAAAATAHYSITFTDWCRDVCIMLCTHTQGKRATIYGSDPLRIWQDHNDGPSLVGKKCTYDRSRNVQCTFAFDGWIMLIWLLCVWSLLGAMIRCFRWWFFGVCLGRWLCEIVMITWGFCLWDFCGRLKIRRNTCVFFSFWCL